MDYSDQKKELVKEVLTPEYMSSEESEISDTEGGQIVSAYVIKKLSWERSRFTMIKNELDKKYLIGLPTRVRS